MTPDPPDLPEDLLEQDARIDEVSRMTAENSTLTPEQRERNRQRSIANIKRVRLHHGLTLMQLAKMIGVKESTVSETLSGTYKGRSDEILGKLEGSLNELARRRSLRQAEGYVDIRIARQVFSALKAVSKCASIGAIFGVSGIGKTMALEAAIKTPDFSTALLVKIDDRSRSRMNFCRALLRAVCGGRQTDTFWTVAEYLEAIIGRLADSGRMILIDEAENLPAETLNLIRQIHDATRCPVVFCGRPHLDTVLDRTTRCPQIGGSLVGRICYRRLINPESGAGGGNWICTIEEMAKMLGKYKVRFAGDATRWLHRLAHDSALRQDTGREAGGLRLVIKIAMMAVAIRRGADLITLDMVKDTYRLMVGDKEAQLLAGLIDRNLRRQDQEQGGKSAAAG